MHARQRDIGAFVKTRKLYTWGGLAAGTDTGDPVDIRGFKSAVLMGAVGEATGSPEAQQVVVSLDAAPVGDNGQPGTWAAVEATAITLTANEAEGEKDLRLTSLPDGTAFLRAKVVVAFTAGTSPKQAVSAWLVLGGHYSLPV
jgi:hypothetical protein